MSCTTNTSTRHGRYIDMHDLYNEYINSISTQNLSSILSILPSWVKANKTIDMANFPSYLAWWHVSPIADLNTKDRTQNRFSNQTRTWVGLESAGGNPAPKGINPNINTTWQGILFNYGSYSQSIYKDIGAARSIFNGCLKYSKTT